MWRAPTESEKPETEPDETVMSVEAESEEIYESRVYGLKPSPELLYVLSILDLERGEGREEPGLADALRETARGISATAVKVLAKRRRSDGLLSFVVVVTGPAGRALMNRQDLVTERVYRRVVRKLEGELLSPGLVNAPLVTTAEDWRRYANNLESRQDP